MTTRPLLADSAPIHEAESVDELAELREEVSELRNQLSELTREFDRDRTQLLEILQALRAVFNGSAQAPPGEASMPPVGQTNPRWEALKRAFPGRPTELIDVLIAHGPLLISQIGAIMRSDPRTVSQIVYKLNKAGAIEKNGGKISLK